MNHSLTLTVDENDWDVAQCVCGWIGPPCPDVETAAEFYVGHQNQFITGPYQHRVINL